MNRAVRIGSWVVAVVLGAVASPQAATIAFDDGLAHTIPGDPTFLAGDGIILSNASQLLVAPAAAIAGEDDLTGTLSAGSAALISESGTRVDQSGGSILGGLAMASYVGAPASSFAEATGGTGIESAGDFEMSDGEVVGGTATATAAPRMNRAEAYGGEALVLSSGFSTIASGQLASGAAASSGSRTNNVARSGDAAVVSSGAVLTIRGGTHSSADAVVDNHDTSSGHAAAETGSVLNVHAGGTVVIHGGTFESGSVQAISGSSNANSTGAIGSGVRAEDGSRVAIHGGVFGRGGSFVAATGTTTVVTPASIRLNVTGADSPTRITILGGSFGSDIGLDIPFTNETPTDARVTIAGGQFSSDLQLRLAHPGVTTVIEGYLFSVNGVPNANGPVTATSGTILGVIPGEAIIWRFQRLNGAPLVLPEPANGLGLGPLVLAAVVRGRTRARDAARG